MDIRLLTLNDAEAFWHLRFEALRNDPASFADSDLGARRRVLNKDRPDRPGIALER